MGNKQVATSILDEIHHQPQSIEHLMDGPNVKHAKVVVDAIRAFEPRYVFIVARGSSDHAGVYAKYLWGMRNQWPVAMAAPSMFTQYNMPPSVAGALVVGISQSGKSPDLSSVIETAKMQGALTLALTNDTASPLAHHSQLVLDICAGEERAVAATKSYTSTLVAIALLSALHRDDEDLIRELHELPSVIEECFRQEKMIELGVQRYRFIDRCVILARGLEYATAFEWALKLKELTYIAAHAYSTADFRHGPLAMLEHGFPVFSVATEGPTFADSLDLFQEARQRLKTELVCISDNDAALELANLGIRLPNGLSRWATPVASTVLSQLFTYYLTISKGYNPDMPRGLSKVTLTL